MESEKNNESSSKNAHSSGFSGVGESFRFNNDEKDYSIPVRHESSDDFVKGCDEKAVKIDEVLKMAIHQGPVDQSGIADVQEGCVKDVLCDGAPAGSSGAGRIAGETNNEYIGRSDMSATAVSSLQNAETPVNATSSKDLSNFGSKSGSWLPRASDIS
ncbi:hypothetical protein HAX54_051306 [Datura stramonium]|uniref:Uncharacterized protein n=1 Tax=Datura stramonium TaxID=4076 RepID=A0ABS8SXI5_DATST|nr:hypothetical protein [Datura stramonium]